MARNHRFFIPCPLGTVGAQNGFGSDLFGVIPTAPASTCSCAAESYASTRLAALCAANPALLGGIRLEFKPSAPGSVAKSNHCCAGNVHKLHFAVLVLFIRAVETGGVAGLHETKTLIHGGGVCVGETKK